MNTSFKSLGIALLLLCASGVQAAPVPTHSGYFASATWSTGGWPTNTMSQTIGPFVSPGQCYEAWMQLVHSYPQYYLISTTPCHLVSTHMAYAKYELAVGDDDGDFGSVGDLLDYAEEVQELRRRYNIDEFESELERLR